MLPQLKKYSALTTPNARMPENDAVCKADIWPIIVEKAPDKPHIYFTPSTCSKKAYFKWSFPNVKEDSSYMIRIYMKENGSYTFKAERQLTKTSANLETEPGQYYKIEVLHFDPTLGEDEDEETVELEFKAVYSKKENEELYELAVQFVRNTPMIPFTMLDRCKPALYWDELDRDSEGRLIMEPYIKDNSGHAASPLNGHIRGLFFYTNRINDQYKCFSTLGNTCLDIYAERLLDPNLINVYFADMYCFSHWSQLFFKKLFNVPLNNKKPEHQFEKPHYITLVVCKKDSRSDLFCEDHIKKLELHNNLFLKTRPNKEDPNLVEFFTNPRVNVEILYTEELKIYQTELQTVEVRGKGTVQKQGNPASMCCTKCNIEKQNE